MELGKHCDCFEYLVKPDSIRGNDVGFLPRRMEFSHIGTVCAYVCVCVYAHATGSLMVAMQGPGSVPGLWVARVATYDGSY